ncbi:MAG: response regulator [Pseudomonadota bacterium]
MSTPNPMQARLSAAARFATAQQGGATTSKPRLLLVDDEERILRSLAMLFRAQYDLRTTTDAHEALRIVEREQIHVIVSDQKMPIMRGADLLKQVKQISPNTMRLLLTGYSELDAVVDSVNEGEIFRFLNKPWDAQDLRTTVAQAMEIAEASFSAPPQLPGAMAEAAPNAAPSAAQLMNQTGSFVSPMSAEWILVVDDDPEVAKVIQEIAGPNQPVRWARSIDEAFTRIAEDNIGVVIAELEVGGERFTGALKALKRQHPEVVSMVITPFNDAGTLIGLINEGQIYRLIPKPIRKGPLAMNLVSALKQHRLLKAAPKAVTERFAVQATRSADEISIGSRVMGLLSRLRGRTA